MAGKKNPHLVIRKPDDFQLIIVGDSDSQIKKELAQKIKNDEIRYIDRNQEPELVEQLLGDAAKDTPFPIAIVAEPGSEDGITCAISAIGESIIVHCEDKVIPLKEKEDQRLPD